MTVGELIEELKKYPDYYPVIIFFDGAASDCSPEDIKNIKLSRRYSREGEFPHLEIEVE